MNSGRIRVELVHAESQRAVAKTFIVELGASVGDVLRLAGADCDFAAVNFSQSRFGIFGKPTGADALLKEGDRIEIYRPLLADPKTARRARAKQTSKSGRS